MATRSAVELVSGRAALRVGLLESIRRRPIVLLVCGVVALLGVLFAGVVLGNVAVDSRDTLAILAHRLLGWPVAENWAPAAETIVIDLRLPRVLAAMLVGGGLAVAGSAFQGVLRNPLADPYVLGTASGAALGAAIAVTVPVQFALLGLGLLHVLAFTGALAAIAIVYRVSQSAAGGSLTGLLLTGYAIGSLLAAGLALTMYLSGSHLRQIFSYLLGSFAASSWESLTVAAPIIVIASLLIAARARGLNALLLGEEAASHLGVDVRHERRVLLGLASLVTAASVATSGLVGFVGLVVPHVVRLLVGPDARLVVPLSALLGASLLPLADLVARVPGELPVGVVTAILGAPFFLYLLRRVRVGYEL